jgi:hypothetical protein
VDLAVEWLRCRSWLLPAIERTNGTHIERDIVDGLMRGQFILWPGENSAIVTEFLNYPRLKCLNWFLAGGKLEELLTMEKEICAWAKTQGCSRVSLGGRKGWKRALQSYDEYLTLLYKDL